MKDIKYDGLTLTLIIGLVITVLIVISAKVLGPGKFAIFSIGSIVLASLLIYFFEKSVIHFFKKFSNSEAKKHNKRNNLNRKSSIGPTKLLTSQLTINTILEGRYLIVSFIDCGGMGAVYKALDQRLDNRIVAIKEMIINFDRKNLQEAVSAFKKEASILINLDHPSLPRITDFFSCEKGKHWYLVMDFIEGETLENIVKRKGPIAEDKVLDWARQLCEVLDYLHTQTPPVIFRDLKPSNIMLTPEGRIKLIDFGIARHFKPGKESDTAYYGSMGFSAPEQFGEGQTDARTDIFSLGAILHYLLTGNNPSNKPFYFEPLSVIVKVSPNLEKVVAKTLEFDPSNRPNSVKEVMSLLLFN